jgi:hypothetical protein
VAGCAEGNQLQLELNEKGTLLTIKATSSPEDVAEGYGGTVTKVHSAVTVPLNDIVSPSGQTPVTTGALG